MNRISLTNEHGDVFLRHNDLDDCGPVSGEGYEDFPPNNQQYYNNQRPSPVESDYFYDQYVDFPINDTVNNSLTNSNLRFNQTSPYVDFNQNKFTLNQFPPRPPQPTSAFTFFGQPLPSLNLGSLWGSGRNANNRAASGENSSRGKGRVQIFRPGDPELQVVFNRPNNELETSDSKNQNREPAASVKNPVVNAPLDKMEEKFYRPYFQTPFSQPKLEFPKERPIEKGFSLPRPEKGFAPMIPGSVGGFIPIEDPMIARNESEIKNKRNQLIETATIVDDNDDDDDDDLKQVHLVTKAESVTRRTIIKPADSYTAQIEKVGTTTTISHLTTSLSPILSTLLPKKEIVTENPKFNDFIHNTPDSREIHKATIESELRNNNRFDKHSFEEEIYHPKNNIQSSTVPSTTTTTTSFSVNKHISTSTLTASIETIESGIEEQTEDDIDEFDHTGSSDLSADHLIAPGSIISQEITNTKPSLSISKPGKITKVFTPAPPANNNNNNEISKLVSPFYPQQFSSEPPANFDNEYQPNQIYQQTIDEKDKINDHDTALYEREDMQWYFQNYHNQTQSNPILNYNSQPYDNNYGSGYNSSPKISSMKNLILILVIACYFH